MKGYWTMMMVLVLGFVTGCPDDDTCTDPCECEGICDGGDADADTTDGDVDPEGSDADADDNGGDADADGDTTETEDDASDEGTTSCPSVAGTWEITYLPAGSRYPFYLEQVGCSLTGHMEEDTFTGGINEDGSLALYDRTGTVDEDLTGNLVSPTRMTGNWSRSTGSSGTWEAVLQ
ncbi:MAG: hypothetical protein WC560_13145 [Syntrophales bacterium]